MQMNHHDEIRNYPGHDPWIYVSIKTISGEPTLLRTFPRFGKQVSRSESTGLIDNHLLWGHTQVLAQPVTVSEVNLPLIEIKSHLESVPDAMQACSVEISHDNLDTKVVWRGDFMQLVKPHPTFTWKT